MCTRQVVLLLRSSDWITWMIVQLMINKIGSWSWRGPVTSWLELGNICPGWFLTSDLKPNPAVLRRPSPTDESRCREPLWLQLIIRCKNCQNRTYVCRIGRCASNCLPFQEQNKNLQVGQIHPIQLFVCEMVPSTPIALRLHASGNTSCRPKWRKSKTVGAGRAAFCCN